MLEVDTFLLMLYVTVDDICKHYQLEESRPGPDAALSRSEVITLALFGQWGWFSSERAFYRYAQRHLRRAFPTLPDRSQFNRAVRQHFAALVVVGQVLAEWLGARTSGYEVLDGTGVPVRNPKRAGAGWLAGQADIGWSNRLGWYEGLSLWLATSPEAAITGFGLAPASTKDQRAAETFFALRHRPDPRLPSVGRPSGGPYVADKGFEGRAAQQRWRERYGAQVVCPPQGKSHAAWPPALERWLAGLRQIVETVIDKLQHTFRLRLERPHHLSGLYARLAAKVALHNFCLWLNRQLGRDPLAFAELVAW